jgi:hypothetical protein
MLSENGPLWRKPVIQCVAEQHPKRAPSNQLSSWQSIASVRKVNIAEEGPPPPTVRLEVVSKEANQAWSKEEDGAIAAKARFATLEYYLVFVVFVYHLLFIIKIIISHIFITSNFSHNNLSIYRTVAARLSESKCNKNVIDYHKVRNPNFDE